MGTAARQGLVVGAAKDCEKCGTVSMQCNNCNREKHNGPIVEEGPVRVAKSEEGSLS